MTRLNRTLTTLLLFLFASVYAVAQTSNGAVIGAITDPSGAAIVGATVTITSVDTGAARTTVTLDNGTYRIESVLPGNYKLSASANGFETTVSEGLIVPASASVSASLTLKVGKTSDRVVVSADNSNLNTENGQVSGTINEMEISSLPISTLNPYQLALTLPGVMTNTQGGFSNGVDINVGGGRPRSNNFLIEGQDNNDAGIGGQGFQPEDTEAIKEVVIIENAYTAEYGHGAGSVSNLILKSGTNQLHGSIFERSLNSSLDTIDKSTHYSYIGVPTGIPAAALPKYRENLPGFTVGGPIIKNKLFGFGAYQWDYYRATALLSKLAVPSPAGLATLKALPSNTRLNNLITAWGGLSNSTPVQGSATNIYLGLDPVTLANRGTVLMQNVQRNLGNDSNSPEMDLKGDYIPSEKDTLNLRYIWSSFSTPFDVGNNPGQLPGFDTDQTGTAQNAGIVETHSFNLKLVNELRLSYGRIGFTFGLPPSTTSNPLFGQPGVTVSNLTGYGVPTAFPQGRFHDTYQLQDSVSWTHNKHFVKIGFDLSDIRVRDQVPFNFWGTVGFADDATTSSITVPGTPPTVATFKYTGLANLIDDFGGSSSTVTQNFGSPTARPQLVYQNYFVQDTYRPIPDLSLDYGFRYEYNGAPFNAPGTPYPGFDPTNIGCFPTASVTCNTKEQADGQGWGPRAGIAYSPEIFGVHKSVIRVGFGVFYDVLFTNIIDNTQASAPNAASPVITSSSSGRGTSSWYEQFANLNHNPLPTNTAEPIVDHMLRPRTMHWNMGVQQELPWATTFQVNYVGERGEHLFGNTNMNPYVNDTLSGARVIPTRGAIIARDNSNDSNYTGLWAELDHKFNHAFMARASYTLGHAFDTGSEVFTTNNESSYQFSRYPTHRGTTDYGPSEYDHRQRLVVSYIWTPSIWHTEGSMKILGNIVNRWAFAGITQFQTGTPENVEVGYDGDGDGISNDRPQLGNPNAPMNTYAFDDSWYYGVSQGTLCSGPSLWYSATLPCEVVSPSSVHWIVAPYGSHPAMPIGRNSHYSKGFQEWDVNIQRSFKLYKSAVIDFRGELFNAFNHGLPGYDANSSAFDVVENTNLITGIISDNWGNYSASGTAPSTFAASAPTVGGHRHARLFIRIQF